jgi:hypothetical protein
MTEEIKSYNNSEFEKLLYNSETKTFTLNGTELEWKKQKSKYNPKVPNESSDENKPIDYEYEYISVCDTKGVRKKIYKSTFEKKYNKEKIKNSTKNISTNKVSTNETHKENNVNSVSDVLQYLCAISSNVDMLIGMLETTNKVLEILEELKKNMKNSH